jgi:hypothetical protein
MRFWTRNRDLPKPRSASVAPTVTKSQLKKFEALLDDELARRSINGCDANQTLMLACNIAEAAATHKTASPMASTFNDGIVSFAAHLVSGRSGAAPEIERLFEDLVFGAHYHLIRDFLYYSYNAPGAINWTITERAVEIQFHDRSLPRQFFTTRNEWYFLSEKTFRGFDAPADIRRMLKGTSEFDLGEMHQVIDPLLQKYADRKLEAYFSILNPEANIDLGGYNYRDFFAVYRILMMKALYHRYQTEVNDVSGCVFMETEELAAMLAEETGVDGPKVGHILQDLVYDELAVTSTDASYFSLMREGAPPHRIIMRPYDFSKAEGLVQLLRVVAQRRPKDFLSNVSNVLGTQFVQRIKAAFEAQGFICRSELSLRAIDPKLPDIDLLVIAEEPTLGFVLLVCEVKSPLPPRSAKDQLRSLAPDSVSKAFRQVEAIAAFLRRPEGIDFIRSILPNGGIEHFDDFVTVIQQLIITSDNAGMFFGHEQTQIINFRTLERLLESSDGDILHIRTCIRAYNKAADDCMKPVMTSFEMGDLTVSYQGFTQTVLMDFPKNAWRGSPDRQQMIDDFLAGGHHPFDCLEGLEVVVAPLRRRAGPHDLKDPSATPT